MEQAQAELGKLRIPESECHRTRASKFYGERQASAARQQGIEMNHESPYSSASDDKFSVPREGFVSPRRDDMHHTKSDRQHGSGADTSKICGWAA